MHKTLKGKTYVVSSFFNEESEETVFDKVTRVMEREAATKAA